MSEAMVHEVSPPLQQVTRELQAAVADLFEVHDVTMGTSGEPETIRLRGRLLAPSEQAYPKITARFRKLIRINIRTPKSTTNSLALITATVSQGNSCSESAKTLTMSGTT